MNLEKDDLANFIDGLVGRAYPGALLVDLLMQFTNLRCKPM